MNTRQDPIYENDVLDEDTGCPSGYAWCYTTTGDENDVACNECAFDHWQSQDWER